MMHICTGDTNAIRDVVVVDSSVAFRRERKTSHPSSLRLPGLDICPSHVPLPSKKSMGNRAGHQLAAHKRHVYHSWTTLYSHDPELLTDAISEAWLKAAELTPTWVWALVGLHETMHATYRENKKFMMMVYQVREFLHSVIKLHKCDTEMAKSLAFRLGMRHRQYMNEGNDNSYWTPFAQQLPISITKCYLHMISTNNRFRKILRIGAHGDRTEEEELLDSWKKFMNLIVEAMKRGYEGCATEKTALRLSITNSIISMAPVRSTRSRSACQFLEPTLSPAMTCNMVPSTSSTPTIHHERSRSIFRNRASRASRDLSAMRRQSSPNNPGSLLTATDHQLLNLANQRTDGRRSLTMA